MLWLWGALCLHPRPKRGSELHDNAEWMRINIAALALVSYYAVCSVFALGPFLFFFYLSQNAGKFSSAPRVTHMPAMWRKINQSVFLERSLGEEVITAQSNWASLHVEDQKEKRMLFPLLKLILSGPLATSL